jgi:hypothetical protein
MRLDRNISLTLSGIRALIGEVTPCLRSASIEFQNETIVFKCVFDETASDDDLELMSAAAAEIIADFPDADLKEIFFKVAPPNSTEPLENILYHRHESN